MRPIARTQYTLGQLMMLVAMTAFLTALVDAMVNSTGVNRLLAIVGAVWFFPVSILMLFALREDRDSGPGWLSRLLTAKRCPRCACRALVPVRALSLSECGACGVRYRRQRDGSWAVVWATERRAEWIGPYLKHLRALRREMRPVSLPIPITLNAGPVDDEQDELAFLRSGMKGEPARDSEAGRRTMPARPASRHDSSRSLRAGLLTVGFLGLSAFAIFVLLLEASRLVAKDYQTLMMVLTVVLYTLYFGLLIGLMGSFRWWQVLLMLTATAGVQALLLGMAGREPNLFTLLGTSISIPTVPLLFASLIARFDRSDDGPRESSCGALLRSKRRRLRPRLSRRSSRNPSTAGTTSCKVERPPAHSSTQESVSVSAPCEVATSTTFGEESSCGWSATKSGMARRQPSSSSSSQASGGRIDMPALLAEDATGRPPGRRPPSRARSAASRSAAGTLGLVVEGDAQGDRLAGVLLVGGVPAQSRVQDLQVVVERHAERQARLAHDDGVPRAALEPVALDPDRRLVAERPPGGPAVELGGGPVEAGRPARA